MNFRLSDSEERLRAEVCEFLAAELGTSHSSDPQPMPPGYMPAREFELKLGAKGWLGLSWPREYGGGGQPVSHQFVDDASDGVAGPR